MGEKVNSLFIIIIISLAASAGIIGCLYLLKSEPDVVENKCYDEAYNTKYHTSIKCRPGTEIKSEGEYIVCKCIKNADQEKQQLRK